MINDIMNIFNLDCTRQELVQYIIIYLRKSRKDAEFNKEEAIEKTLERHETMLQEYAINTFGCKIPEKNIYKEVVSGDTIADRPQMQKVLELIENNNIKGVLCIEIERLARGNSIDQGIIAEKFKITNTKILTPQKIFDLDNEFDLSFFEDGLYQSRKFLLYTKKILARGREQSVKEGKCVKSTPNFGYKKEKLKGQKGFNLIKDENNKYVRMLFDFYINEDIGITNLAHKLNNLSFPTPSDKSTQWTAAMVRSILNRAEFYAGYVTWNQRKTEKKYVNGELITTRPLNKNCLKEKGLHEPTITEEELKIVQKKREKSSKNTPKANVIKNPLAGVVICGFCGCTMKRRPYNKSFLKNGNIHEDTLLCITPNCPNTSSNLSVVESAILELIQSKINDYKDYIDNYSSNATINKNNYEKEIKELDNSLEKVENQKTKACEFLESGVYDESTFLSRITILNDKIKEIKKQKEEIMLKQKEDKINTYQKMLPLLEYVFDSYQEANISKRNELLTSVFKEIRYKKTNKGGRWNKDAMNDFTLDIVFKI